MQSGTQNPVLFQYLKKYQEDPTSRVFAPLAEAYRKAGLIDEAIEIAREGLAHHPQFVGGKVALARALFEKKQFEQVIHLLSNLIHDVPDNLIAQRLLADSNLMLGRVAEALSAYKMLLYYAPIDREVAKIVAELEPQVYHRGSLVIESDFQVVQVQDAMAEEVDPKTLWIRKVKALQGALQRIESYRYKKLTVR